MVVPRTLTTAEWNTRVVGDVAGLHQDMVLFGGSEVVLLRYQR
ncbi:hypothetical protein [Allokutzneria sp. NRRL B-24872]|nr:hypothetical protein [Allokutzneria sp. NRRL B-24872]